MPTSSEQLVADLCRRSFLSLWSHLSPHSDEGLSGDARQGEEICDLLVIFGDDIIIFSVKESRLTKHQDPLVNWNRWYVGAVKRSLAQLQGAENFLRRFPSRVFKDRSCAHRLEVGVPLPDRMRVHRVSVALFRHDELDDEEFHPPFLAFEGGAGVPLGKSSVPFVVGAEVTPNGSYVHVLGERTLHALIQELGTAQDFVDYLRCKEAILQDCTVTATYEEDFLAHYILQGRSLTPENGPFNLAETDSGLYGELLKHPLYLAAKSADRMGQTWDALIEAFTDSWRSGSLEGGSPPEVRELILRRMASFDRLSRRRLGEMINAVTSDQSSRFRCLVLKDCVTAIASMKLPPRAEQMSAETYNDLRVEAVRNYALTLRLEHASIVEALVIVLSPRKNEEALEWEAVLIDLSDWTEEKEMRAAEIVKRFEFNRQNQDYKDVEFPDGPSQPLLGG